MKGLPKMSHLIHKTPCIESTPEGMTTFPDAREISVPTAEETARFEAEGLAIDRDGRPLHPDFFRVLGEHGVRFGKGDFWHWGPNKTVDPIVIAEKSGAVLVIRRADNGLMALPGGFRDLNDGVWEMPHDAALREAREETGVELRGVSSWVQPEQTVRDHRETLNAWPNTVPVDFIIPDEVYVKAGDDAEKGSALWLPESKIGSVKFHGSHLELIRAAFARLRDRKADNKPV